MTEIRETLLRHCPRQAYALNHSSRAERSNNNLRRRNDTPVGILVEGSLYNDIPTRTNTEDSPTADTAYGTVIEVSAISKKGRELLRINPRFK